MGEFPLPLLGIFSGIPNTKALMSLPSLSKLDMGQINKVGDFFKEYLIESKKLWHIAGQPSSHIKYCLVIDLFILLKNVFSQGKGNKEQQFYFWFGPTTDFHT